MFSLLFSLPLNLSPFLFPLLRFPSFLNVPVSSSLSQLFTFLTYFPFFLYLFYFNTTFLHHFFLPLLSSHEFLHIFTASFTFQTFSFPTPSSSFIWPSVFSSSSTYPQLPPLCFPASLYFVSAILIYFFLLFGCLATCFFSSSVSSEILNLLPVLLSPLHFPGFLHFSILFYSSLTSSPLRLPVYTFSPPLPLSLNPPLASPPLLPSPGSLHFRFHHRHVTIYVSPRLSFSNSRQVLLECCLCC